jgi:hypothetical protein
MQLREQIEFINLVGVPMSGLTNIPERRADNGYAISRRQKRGEKGVPL